MFGLFTKGKKHSLDSELLKAWGSPSWSQCCLEKGCSCMAPCEHNRGVSPTHSTRQRVLPACVQHSWSPAWQRPLGSARAAVPLRRSGQPQSLPPSWRAYSFRPCRHVSSCIHTGPRRRIMLFSAVFYLGSCLSISWSEQTRGCPVTELHHTRQDFPDFLGPLDLRPRLVTTCKKCSPDLFPVPHNNLPFIQILGSTCCSCQQLTAWEARGKSPYVFHTLPTDLAFVCCPCLLWCL